MRAVWIYLVIIVVACSMSALPPQRAVPGPGEVVPWESSFRSEAGPYWIERAAQSHAECGWNQMAVSPVGATGPAQVMPSTLRWWKAMGWVPTSSTGFDIPASMRGQNRHMLWLRRYWGSLDKRLAAYNAGQGNILRAEALADEIGWESDDAWLRLALPRITKANAKETQGYVARNAAYRADIVSRLKGRP